MVTILGGFYNGYCDDLQAGVLAIRPNGRRRGYSGDSGGRWGGFLTRYAD